MRPRALTCAGVVLCVLALAPAASAGISDTQLIDGPSDAIGALGAVAMSEDGTGGLAYVKRDDDGRDHIFVAQFVDGRWRAPQRVDRGPTQRFASSWPAIGAGNGGRLIVTWVQEFGPADRMYSAALTPGSRSFEAPVPVDLNVGDSALGTWPDLAMSRGGQAFLVYRVITDAQPATAPPGSVQGEYRVARSSGQLWSGIGTPINRNLEGFQRTPGAANRPRIAMDDAGGAVVAFAELDDNFIERVFLRRIFSSGVQGIVKQVSPSKLADRDQFAGADTFDLDVGRFGSAAVAYRQRNGPGSGLTRPRMLLAQLTDVFSTEAATPKAPRFIDGAEGFPSIPGTPAVAVAGQAFLAGLSTGGAVVATAGDEETVATPQRLDDAAANTVAFDPAVELAESGASALAFKVRRGNQGFATVRETTADGVPTDAVATGPRGGQVDQLISAGSGLGDAIFAFSQGTGGLRQIAASVVDAPPGAFAVQTPLDFTRAARVPIAWDRSEVAIGSVRYSLVIDDDTVRDGVATRSANVATRDLDDGVLAVQVVATDSAGQETTSVPAELKLDTTPPKVEIKRLSGRRVQVRVLDGRAGQVSGARGSRTTIAWGDGSRATRGRARAVRRYRRGRSRVRVTVRTADAVGNRATVRRTVRL